MRNLTIKPPGCLHEIGGRKNNEDAVYPTCGQAGTEDRLFIVCDGVGGSNKGEIASSLACQSIAQYIGTGSQSLDGALLYAESNFTNCVDLYQECAGMATTAVVLLITQTSCLIGWVGDSRAYHIRDGRILYQTRDHSLVNRLVDMGEITQSEARTHEQRNVIVRAIVGQYNPVEFEMKLITDIQPNDFFFLCSDGIIEVFEDAELEALFVEKNSVEFIQRELDRRCRKEARDNYSMYLVQLASC